jgi:large subunit ribosomal protein L5e
MPFVKVVKNKAYFKRYQVQYKRRRQCKTDYRARRAMILQDKTKFNAPKYRLVVRISNKDIIAQIVHAKMGGDFVVMAAYAHELPLFGIKYGLTNYAAAYATGLLLARRTLTKLKIADKFAGVKEANGEFQDVKTKKNPGEDDNRFPFKAILDVGLTRTTTGARIFGVLKGAVDGGIAVPHKETRFPGYDKSKSTLNAKVHRDHIFGLHVASYLKQVKADNDSNPDEKGNQFAKMLRDKVTPDSIEKSYKAAHAAIRADPMKKKPKKESKAGAKSKAYNTPRLSRKARVTATKKRVEALRKKLSA